MHCQHDLHHAQFCGLTIRTIRLPRLSSQPCKNTRWDNCRRCRNVVYGQLSSSPHHQTRHCVSCKEKEMTLAPQQSMVERERYLDIAVWSRSAISPCVSLWNLLTARHYLCISIVYACIETPRWSNFSLTQIVTLPLDIQIA